MPITDPAHLLLEVRYERRFSELDALPCLRGGAPMRLVSATAKARMRRRLRRRHRGPRGGPQGPRMPRSPPRAPPLGPVLDNSAWHENEPWDEDPRRAFDQAPRDGDDTT
jgi:hypothetical protein